MGIASQRNSRGGFHSTQDTVVGLQALAAYAINVGDSPLNADLRLQVKTTSNEPDFMQTYSFTDSNKLVLQREKLQGVPAGVVLTAQGTGCILFQTISRYNIPAP